MFFACWGPEQEHLLANDIDELFSRGSDVLGDYGVGGRVDGLTALQAYCDKRDGDWSADANGGTDLNFAFYPWLRRSFSICSRNLQQVEGSYANFTVTHQGSRYAWISHQEGVVGGAADADEGCHRCSGSDLVHP